MNGLGSSQKRDKFEYLVFIIIIGVSFIISIGCGGGDDGIDNTEIKSDENQGTTEIITDSIIGVWKIKSIRRVDADGNVLDIVFPYSVPPINFTVDGYTRVTDDTISYYVGLDKLPENALYPGGIFYCSEEATSYETDGDLIEAGDGREGTFHLNGEMATFIIQDPEEIEATVTFQLKRVDGDEIYNAEENCEVYETFKL